MAKVTFIYVEDEDDGLQHEQTSIVTRTGVEDLTSLADFVGDAVRAAGYTYVEGVTFTTAEGRKFSSIL